MNLIVDANVLLGAVLGQSLSLVADVAESGTVLLVPRAMMREAYMTIADTVRIPAPGAPGRLRMMESLVDVLDAEHYASQERRARERLSGDGQRDWPLLAASLALNAPIWSNDKHLWGTGVTVWRTRNMRFWGGPAGDD